MSFRIVTASSNFLKWTCSVCLQGLLLLLSNECLKDYNDGVFFARKKTRLQSMNLKNRRQQKYVLLILTSHCDFAPKVREGTDSFIILRKLGSMV